MIINTNLSRTKFYNDNVLPPWPNCNRPNKIVCSAVNNIPDAQDLQVSDIRYVKMHMYNAIRKSMPAPPKSIEELREVL